MTKEEIKQKITEIDSQMAHLTMQRIELKQQLSIIVRDEYSALIKEGDIITDLNGTKYQAGKILLDGFICRLLRKDGKPSLCDRFVSFSQIIKPKTNKYGRRI
jgi:hypothetical protein